MELKDYCIDCFQSTGGEEVCMHCGYVQTDKPRSLCHLYPHTILYDRYIIGRVINNGGFGVVYKAFDTRLNNVVAIKELLPTQNSMVTRMPPSQQVIPVNEQKSQQFIQLKYRFMEEARTVAQFASCESIVQIYDFFEVNNTAYLVMEFLDGETLRDRINRNGLQMSYDEAIAIMLPIMNAVKTIHEKGVIHKDISPDNIFICNDGRVKLIDFGAAKFGDNDYGNDFESIVAKPGYTPPEQYQVNAKVGFYSDIYAIGAVLYTILTGTIPDESIDRLNKDELVKPSKLGVQIPIHVEKTIMKAMALKDSARFKNMDDFVNAINGKKRADYPEVELKKKKALRALLVVFIFAVMIAAVVTTYVVKMNTSLIPTKSTTITLWYRDDGNPDVNARWEKVAKDFNAFAKNQGQNLDDTKLDVVGVPADEYEYELIEAFQLGESGKYGKLPDIYQATGTNLDEYAASLGGLYNSIDDVVDTTPYNVMKKELKEHDTIAFCYDLPVVYAYTDNTSNKLPAEDVSLIDLCGTDASKDFSTTIVCNPDALYYTALAYGLNIDDTDSPEFTQLSDITAAQKIKDKDVAPQQFFTSGSNSMYYIGFMSEYSTISKNIRLGSSSFEVGALTGSNVKNVYVFPETWSISKYSSHLNQQTAELFMYYMLCTTDGQNDCIRVANNTYYLPMLQQSIDSLGYKEYESVLNSSNTVTVVKYQYMYDFENKH